MALSGIQDGPYTQKNNNSSTTGLENGRSLTVVGYADEVYRKCTRVEDWEFNSHLIDVRHMSPSKIRRRIFEKFKILINDTNEYFEKLSNEYIIVSTLEEESNGDASIRPLGDDEIFTICRTFLDPSRCILRLIKIDAINDYKRNLSRFAVQKSSRQQKSFHSISKAFKPKLNYSNLSQHSVSCFGLNNGKINSAVKHFLVSSSKKLLRQVSSPSHYYREASSSGDIRSTERALSRSFDIRDFRGSMSNLRNVDPDENFAELENRSNASPNTSSSASAELDYQDNTFEKSVITDNGNFGESAIKKYSLDEGARVNTLFQNQEDLRKNFPKLLNSLERPPSYIICKNIEVFFPDFKFEKVISEVFLNNNNLNNIGSQVNKTLSHVHAPEIGASEKNAPLLLNDIAKDSPETLAGIDENIVSRERKDINSGAYDGADIAELVKLTLIQCQNKHSRDLKRTSFGRRASQQLCKVGTNLSIVSPVRKSSLCQVGEICPVDIKDRYNHVITPQSDIFDSLERKSIHNDSKMEVLCLPLTNSDNQASSLSKPKIEKHPYEEESSVSLFPMADRCSVGRFQTSEESISHKAYPGDIEAEPIINRFELFTGTNHLSSSHLFDKYSLGKDSVNDIDVEKERECTGSSESLYSSLSKELRNSSSHHGIPRTSIMCNGGAAPDVNSGACTYQELSGYFQHTEPETCTSQRGVNSQYYSKSASTVSELNKLLPAVGKFYSHLADDIHIPNVNLTTSNYSDPSEDPKSVQLKEISSYNNTENSVTEVANVEMSSTIKTDIGLSDESDEKNDRTTNLRVSSICSANSVPERIEWLKGPLIGKGSFGRVFYAVNMRTYEIMAVKQVDIGGKNKNFTKRLVSSLRSEISLMKGISHENVVRYTGFEVRDNTINVFLEYVSGGTITTALSTIGPFESPLVRSITCQVLCGLEYLHERNVIHRDIKGTNILLNENGVAKISDFGVSKKCTFNCPYKTCSRMSFQGSVGWMAPEVVRSKGGYSAKVDIWSLGCVVIEMITGNRPWDNLDQMQTMWKLGKLMHPEFPKNIDKMTESFLSATFTIDPRKRPTASEILKHPFADVDPAQLNFKSYKLRMMKKKAIASTQRKDFAV